MADKFYSDEEAEAILRLASRQSDSGMSHDRLLDTAAELGISKEAVENAAIAYKNIQVEQNLRKEFDVTIKRSFFSNLTAYVIVNLGLLVMNFMTSPHVLWAIWPILGWGIGLAFSFSQAFFKNSEEYEKEFKRWVAKRGLSSSELTRRFLDDQTKAGAGFRDHIQLQIDLKRREATEIASEHANRLST